MIEQGNATIKIRFQKDHVCSRVEEDYKGEVEAGRLLKGALTYFSEK